MQKIKNMKKIQGTSAGVLPQASSRLGSGIVSHGPPVGRLCFLLLSQQRVDIYELLLLLLYVPLPRILHMSVKCILNFTYVDFQSSKVTVDAV